MHLKLHVQLAVALSMNHEHLVDAIIHHMILLYEVPECNDVGYHAFLEPNGLVIPWHMHL